MFICSQPFLKAEIDSLGDVYSCCRFHLPIKMGNIFQNTFDDIWNSDSAVKIRTNILNGDYSMCNKDACFHLLNNSSQENANIELSSVMKTGPKYVSFCYDKECNIACVICRDCICKNSDKELKILNDKIDSFFLPMLKDAEFVTINAHGDPFGSRHSRLLIKKIKETYPNIKFDIFTNGILFNEYNVNDLNIAENIYEVKVSIHSAHKETYAKMIRNGEMYFDNLMNNLKYISKLKQQYKFNYFLLMVVTSLNYKDIPDFVELANKLDACSIISEYRDEQLQSEKKHPEIIITDSSHPEYAELVKVLNNPVLTTSPNIGISPVLKQIKEGLITER